MHPSRLISVAVVLGVVSQALAASTTRTAQVLPEVRKQLNDAHECVQSGSLDYAIAHANLVLVADSLSVCLKFENMSEAEKKTCTRAFNASLDAWQAALDNTIHFRIEDDPAKADIAVRFRSDVRMGKEAVAGFTNWSRTIRSEKNRVVEAQFKADVQVRERDLNRSPMSFEVIRQEAEHEIGHILGLDDSDLEGDLMGPLNMAHPVKGPRDYEIDAVRQLRDEAKQIKANALAQQKG